MISVAHAMGQTGAAGAPAGGGFASFIPLIMMFAIFYFLLIRPQQQKAKEHQAMLGKLKKGDKVMTGGGIYGEITAASDDILTVEIADRVRIKVNRATVSGLTSAPAPADSSNKTPAKKKNNKN